MAEVSMTGGSQQQHFRKGGGTPPHDKCSSVGERLHSRVHVCNHARCAANDPDYNVKSAVPPKKFLVAKKHAYGGLEKGGKSRSGSSTTSSDRHHCDRSHALQSLTNSVLTTENGKARSNGLHSNVHIVLPNRRARDSSSSDSKKVAERKARSTTYSGSSTGRSIVTTESHSKAQKSGLSNVSSIPSPTREQSERCEDSASNASTVTSIRITQILSTTRGEDEEKEEHVAAAASSPTASVGSNLDTELSILTEAVINVEGGIAEQSLANLGDFQSPASESSSNNLHKDPVNEESTCDPPSPSVDSRAPDSVLESITTSTPSTSFASTSPGRSSITTPPSEISSSSVLKSAAGEDINYNSPLPANSRPTGSQLLQSSLTSTNSGPRTSPTSTGRSSRTAPLSPSPAASKLARKFINNLKESSKVGSPVSSSSRASASEPSRTSRNLPVSMPPVDSSPASTSSTRLAKKFITDLQARTVPRKASSKGVRSIELRGGKAQSYSTTTVTSWDVTTTTVETSTITPPEQHNMKRSQAGGAGLIMKANTTANTKAPSTVKFVKNAKSLDEVHAESEKVSLKHGEVAERRLSEEYMTNHALEKKISDNDHRVKVLVHAFETLTTLSDSKVHVSEDKTLNPHLLYESVSATSIAV